MPKSIWGGVLSPEAPSSLHLSTAVPVLFVFPFPDNFILNFVRLYGLVVRAFGRLIGKKFVSS